MRIACAEVFCRSSASPEGLRRSAPFVFVLKTSMAQLNLTSTHSPHYVRHETKLEPVNFKKDVMDALEDFRFDTNRWHQGMFRCPMKARILEPPTTSIDSMMLDKYFLM